MLKNKIARTKEIIRSGHQAFPHGMIAWSGGKDSMVLMHIMRDMGVKLPVIFFREPWQPSKYKFHDEVIKQWGLEIYSWHPYSSSFQQADDEFEVQNEYCLNGTNITCPTGIVPPVEGLPWVCALDIQRRPKQQGLLVEKLEAMWIGHKGCDSDPILGGDAGTRVEALAYPDGVKMLFPLRDWSHADIWEYIETHNVHYDSDRYEKVGLVWGEKADKTHNMDYVHACTACVDRRPGSNQYVHCPKLGMTIQNVAHLVPWSTQEKLSYMKDQ